MAHYFEPRRAPLLQTTELTADLMRHLHARQYLGKAVVVHQSPIPTLRVARKQWLRLARLTQKNRASTINADKILRFTYAITHMQHMEFTAKAPQQHQQGHVYFASPNTLSTLPTNCFTLYICAPLTTAQYVALDTQLPAEALIVDYTGQPETALMHLRPKQLLEQKVVTEWHKIHHFCQEAGVNLTQLTHTQFTEADAMDNALDSLLGLGYSFLTQASAFQHALELAKPFHIPKRTQEYYNTLTVLAYRVQALTPGSPVSGAMLRTYHEDETFFLHDITLDLGQEGEDIGQIASRHQQAGRENLADALLLSADQLSLARLQPKHAAFR